jgi:hypothetical protein
MHYDQASVLYLLTTAFRSRYTILPNQNFLNSSMSDSGKVNKVDNDVQRGAGHNLEQVGPSRREASPAQSRLEEDSAIAGGSKPDSTASGLSQAEVDELAQITREAFEHGIPLGKVAQITMDVFEELRSRASQGDSNSTARPSTVGGGRSCDGSGYSEMVSLWVTKASAHGVSFKTGDQHE